MANQIRTITRVTLTEILREKLVYGVLLLALLATAMSFFVAGISLEQDARVLQDTGLAFSIFALIFATIFVTTNSMSRDIERRALYFLLAKPVSRTQYVVGKFAGLALFSIASFILLNVIFGIGAAFASPGILPDIIANAAAGSLELLIITAVCMLFASFAAPLNASLYTLALVIIGHSQTSLLDFVKQSGNSAIIGIVKTVYYILPNLEKYNIRASLLYDLQLGVGQMLWAIVYAAILIGIALYLTVLVTEKREL